MERKIGETFEYEGKTFKVKEDKNCGCHGCFFYKRCIPAIKMAGECAAACREDNKGVVFVEIQGQTQKAKEPKERKIGETFEFEGHKLKVVDKDGYGCDGCFFLNRECSLIRDVSGFCSDEYRTDKKRVIFVEAKDEQPRELNLCEILKDCPEGFELYSTLYGKVNFVRIDEEEHPIIFLFTDKGAEFTSRVSSEGKYLYSTKGECILFPSKDQRDWSKFNAPWLKKERFDPKTLKPFDRVLVRNDKDCVWRINIYSHKNNNDKSYHDKRYPYICINGEYSFCIPYNDDTKHLVGTKEEAPDFYRYWED